MKSKLNSILIFHVMSWLLVVIIFILVEKEMVALTFSSILSIPNILFMSYYFISSFQLVRNNWKADKSIFEYSLNILVSIYASIYIPVVSILDILYWSFA